MTGGPLRGGPGEMDTAWEVIVVGGGAAGLMAAAAAAARGRRTLLLEKNKKFGVKILMSGGTRCNLTHHASPREVADQFRGAARFLYKAIGQLPPQAVVDLIEAEGVPTKVEATGKVFPVSDRAIDVRDALVRRAERAGAVLVSGVAVKGIARDEIGFRCLVEGGKFTAASLILCTGGKSYPGCGTTGDGYPWAVGLGHTIQPLHPALTPLLSDEAWVHELSGLTLPLVGCRVPFAAERSPVVSRRGALLFTHTGISGPEPMNVSRYYTASQCLAQPWLQIDFLPERTKDSLVADLRQAAGTQGRMAIGNWLERELPERLAGALLERSGLPRGQRLAELPHAQLYALLANLKECPVRITGTKGFDKAEVTAGGIALTEVNPQTMESRLVPGLYLAGEILDVDGPIGGFNFQAAFSTGTLAGRHA